MKKNIIAIVAVALCFFCTNASFAKNSINNDLASAINMYKSKNYSQSYSLLKDYLNSDPSNALAYYYYAMSAAQIGNISEAIDNYSKTINLAPNSELARYAKKGKLCLEDSEACKNKSSSTLDDFIYSKYGTGFSEAVRGDFEKQKIENIMREMNRSKDVSPEKFKDYKDFSALAPTNNEIVEAILVLKRAGLIDLTLKNNYMDLSMINSKDTSSDSILRLLENPEASKVSPQVIQSILTNQMSIGL